MGKIKNKHSYLSEGMATLGFTLKDDSLFLTSSKAKLSNPQIQFHIEKAQELSATAIYVRRQLNGSYKPQVYLFDFTDRSFAEETDNRIAEIQTNIWSSGEAPLAVFFYNTEIDIIDCTRHVTNDYKPEYLIKGLNLANKAHLIYNEQFAIKIKSGTFWEQIELKNKFKFHNSAYDKLINNIRFVSSILTQEFTNTSKEVVNKIIIQSILIKYLEERIDNKGNQLLSEKYFKKYNEATTFSEVLIQKGKFVELLIDLNNDFNGNVFKWETEEQTQLKSLDLSIVSELLNTDKVDLNSNQIELGFPNWRYFEFKLIPVELISRLYEEFLGKDKQEKGLFYTPSHLAKLLVDQCIPLNNYKKIHLQKFTILDPACGSGIFLVVAFKRLVQIWRLQNKMKTPNIGTLKSILKNIFGVDKEEQALRLASFSLSLALCNELNPIKIITSLRFDDLTKENLIHSDFFECKSLKTKKFNLVLGNPPFKVGGLNNDSTYWELNNERVKIPQGQIALKFLSQSLETLKNNGLVCLIIKSSGLLYNSTSYGFKKALFSNFNAIQILDFTALARNKTLWDNGADVATAAIFIKNAKPDYSKNILHLTFRRTRAIKNRIIFEIDDYDLHYVNRFAAINNSVIWKNNLLGGGRIKNLVEKSAGSKSFKEFLIENDCVFGEGFKVGSKGDLDPEFMYSIKTIPTKAINEDGILLEALENIPLDKKFEKIPDELIFRSPNIIIKENIGRTKIPVHLNKNDFSFQHKIIGISSSLEILNQIKDSFNKMNDLYRFLIYTCSGQLLVNLNTAILKRDLMSLPFPGITLSLYDRRVIKDVVDYMQDFIRHGENSKALLEIKKVKLKSIISNYGNEFSRALNSVYGSNERKFRLSDVVSLNNSLIATVFKYDNKNTNPIFRKNLAELNIDGLTTNQISAHLTVNRIIKLYPKKDTIVFIKPNQYRYWLSLIAYRDADKCFSDFSKLPE